MRIVQVTHQYPPHHVGGTERVTQSLADALTARGHVVHVVTRAPVPPAGASRAQEAGVIVQRVAEAASPQARFRATFGDPAAQEAFAAVLDAARPEIVHAQHLIGWPTSIADECRRRGIPLVVTLHDYWFACANAQLITNFDRSICDGPAAMKCGRCAAARSGAPAALNLPLGAALAPLMARRSARLRGVLSGAAAVIAPSRFVAAWFGAHGCDTSRWSVIENAVDAPEVVTRAAPSSAAFRVAYVGGLAWQKGVHILIEAFNRLPRDAELIIAGDAAAFPDYAARLRGIAAHPGIRFAGVLDRRAVWALLADSDVAVVPSLWHETSSLAAREALAAGCYVIASRRGALTELLETGEQGALVRAGDADDLAAALNAAVARRDRLPHRLMPMPAPQGYAERVETVYRACLKPGSA